MRKDFGKQPALFPMPVLTVAGYYATGEKAVPAWNAGKELME